MYVYTSPLSMVQITAILWVYEACEGLHILMLFVIPTEKNAYKNRHVLTSYNPRVTDMGPGAGLQGGELPLQPPSPSAKIVLNKLHASQNIK